jgi:hypothetical protein
MSARIHRRIESKTRTRPAARAQGQGHRSPRAARRAVNAGPGVDGATVPARTQASDPAVCDTLGRRSAPRSSVVGKYGIALLSLAREACKAETPGPSPRSVAPRKGPCRLGTLRTVPFPSQDDLDRARRRPPGDRLLVYLDQSSLSGMVREPDGFGELRAVLVASVRSGRVICVRSPAHDDESALAKEETWFELNELARDLSPGVRFLTAGEIENNEIRVAARELLGKAPGRCGQRRSRRTHTPRANRRSQFSAARSGFGRSCVQRNSTARKSYIKKTRRGP